MPRAAWRQEPRHNPGWSGGRRRGGAPPLHVGIEAGADLRVGRPSPTEKEKTAAARVAIVCPGPGEDSGEASRR
ncbi:hypothetical protein NDU88_002904 [Pleurodeles waltl]|uniref:Uncharacterized protein n=1 Tax=Pleurodeles waltl TaxID=8319 RepID=A0AAV7SCB4_PLEWA|nr:hypothetical protein NDU88_002904 [Pleurodeles waltl]